MSHANYQEKVWLQANKSNVDVPNMRRLILILLLKSHITGGWQAKATELN